jgi:hypothetical protein
MIDLKRSLFIQRINIMRFGIEYEITNIDQLTFIFPMWNIVDLDNHPFNEYL